MSHALRFTVYQHVAPNGKSYVGWTGQAGDKRWLKHTSDATKGSATAFHRAIHKYGADAFEHRVLERMSTEEGVKRAEVAWIRELRTAVPHGYNISLGGDGRTGRGRVFSDEHRRRLAEALRGHKATASTRSRMTEAQRECWARFSAEEKRDRAEKSAAARRGVKRTPEQCARIAEGTRLSRLRRAEEDL